MLLVHSMESHAVSSITAINNNCNNNNYKSWLDGRAQCLVRPPRYQEHWRLRHIFLANRGLLFKNKFCCAQLAPGENVFHHLTNSLRGEFVAAIREILTVLCYCKCCTWHFELANTTIILCLHRPNSYLRNGPPTWTLRGSAQRMLSCSTRSLTANGRMSCATVASIRQEHSLTQFRDQRKSSPQLCWGCVERRRLGQKPSHEQ